MLLTMLPAAAQEINVSEPGAEPDLLQSPVEEDLTLVGVADKSGVLRTSEAAWLADLSHLGKVAGAPLPGAQRMKFFRAAANRKGRSFDCDHVWTFACFQHVIDLSRQDGAGIAVQSMSHSSPETCSVQVSAASVQTVGPGQQAGRAGELGVAASSHDAAGGLTLCPCCSPCNSWPRTGEAGRPQGL